MTDDVVLDASAAVLALIGRSGDAVALRHRLPSLRRHAPHLIDAEVGNVLRRHERRGRIGPAEAAAALTATSVLVDQRYPQDGPLALDAWTWRSNLTFYDSLYVALAARLGVPLLTADGRLARAIGTGCTVEVIGGPAAP